MLTRLKDKPHNPALHHLNIPNKEIATLSVQHKDKNIVGKSTKYLTEITPQTKIKRGDLIYVFGNPSNINHLNSLLAV